MARKTTSKGSSLTAVDTTPVPDGTSSSPSPPSPSSPSPISSIRRPSSSTERLTPTPLASLNLPSLDSSRALPSQHINKANLVELKNACDDAVKKIMDEHQFTQIHKHTDVKLTLGWLAVLVAVGTAGYSYKVGFEDSKGVAAAGVVAYFLLSGIQLAYAYYFEGAKIYTGKRKSLSKRIETEVIRISTRSLPSSSSPPLPPRYLLNLSYRRSANKNKSLIRRARQLVEASYGELVDSQGGVEEEKIRDWIGVMIANVVGGSAEELNPNQEGASSTSTSPAREKS